jgi:hypothetical protein
MYKVNFPLPRWEGIKGTLPHQGGGDFGIFTNASCIKPKRYIEIVFNIYLSLLTITGGVLC